MDSADFVFSMLLFTVAGVFGHLILFRLFRPSRFVLVTCSYGLCVSLLRLSWLVFVGESDILFWLLMDLSFWGLLLTFFVNLQNSISLRIISGLNDSPGAILEFKDLTKQYSCSDSVDSRLARMQSNRLIQIAEHGPSLTRSGRLVAKSILGARQLLGVKNCFVTPP